MRKKLKLKKIKTKEIQKLEKKIFKLWKERGYHKIQKRGEK